MALIRENQKSNVINLVHHVTEVQEKYYDVHQWHIYQVPSVRKNTCFAM